MSSWRVQLVLHFTAFMLCADAADAQDWRSHWMAISRRSAIAPNVPPSDVWYYWDWRTAPSLTSIGASTITLTAVNATWTNTAATSNGTVGAYYYPDTQDGILLFPEAYPPPGAASASYPWTVIMSFWTKARITSTSDDVHYYSSGTGTAVSPGDFFLYSSADNSLHFTVSYKGSWPNVSLPTVAVSNWVCCAVTFCSTNIEIYLQGKYAKFGADMSQTRTDTYSNSAGRATTATKGMRGYVSSLVVCTGVLNGASVSNWISILKVEGSP